MPSLLEFKPNSGFESSFFDLNLTLTLKLMENKTETLPVRIKQYCEYAAGFNPNQTFEMDNTRRQINISLSTGTQKNCPLTNYKLVPVSYTNLT